MNNRERGDSFGSELQKAMEAAYRSGYEKRRFVLKSGCKYNIFSEARKGGKREYRHLGQDMPRTRVRFGRYCRDPPRRNNKVIVGIYMKNLTTVDLFCGCGGMSLGFQNAGFNVVAAFDNWKPAIEVYRKNFSHPIHQQDIADEDTKELIRNCHPNIIVGGPPCQDFSTAGPRDEQLGRAKLTVTFAEIVASVRPQFFVMENVPVIKNSLVLARALETFKLAGYGLTQRVLDASYCGVPQTRKRFFLIGHLGGTHGFLDHYLERGLASKPMTMHDYLGDSLGVDYYFRVPTNFSRRGVFCIYEPCVTIRGIDRPISKGYKGHPKDPVEIGPKVRALTVLERSYIQTFPREFIFEGPKSDLNQMIGNAVPVRLAQYVGNALKDYIDDIEKRGVHN